VFYGARTSRSAAAVIESCWPDAHQADHVKGSVSQIADCIRMHACCAAHVLVIFGATRNSSSGQREGGRSNEKGLNWIQARHFSLPFFKVSCSRESEMDLAERSPAAKRSFRSSQRPAVYACAERTSGSDARPLLTSWQVSSYANACFQLNETVVTSNSCSRRQVVAHDLEG
jgi:hypothetical protein